MPACLIGLEACAGAHYWARELSRYGHCVRLIAAQFVKPYLKSGKNDANDAEAICEALSRPGMRFVAIKSVEQQVLQSEHRIRSRLIRARTALGNQIRGLLGEVGIVVAPGLTQLRRALPVLLEQPETIAHAKLRSLLSELAEELRTLDDRLTEYDRGMHQSAREDERMARLMQIEGIGPISASALVCAVGEARQFASGRDMAAWLGLVPRQHSSGGKARLGAISKRGDGYVRTLLVHGARAVLKASARKTDPRSCSIQSLATRRNRNVATVALANKNARIAWAILSRQEEYRRPARTAEYPLAETAEARAKRQ